MGDYAIIESGTVVNIAVSDPEYAASQGWIALPEGVQIGWSYINGEFVDNRPAPDTGE